jgi:hypothetical protein
LREHRRSSGSIPSSVLRARRIVCQLPIPPQPLYNRQRRILQGVFCRIGFRQFIVIVIGKNHTNGVCGGRKPEDIEGRCRLPVNKVCMDAPVDGLEIATIGPALSNMNRLVVPREKGNRLPLLMKNRRRFDPIGRFGKVKGKRPGALEGRPAVSSSTRIDRYRSSQQCESPHRPGNSHGICRCRAVRPPAALCTGAEYERQSGKGGGIGRWCCMVRRSKASSRNGGTL